MNRLRLAAWATVAGLGVVAGCASPCSGPGCGRLGFLHHRGAECCPPTCTAGACPGCDGGPIPGGGPILGEGGPLANDFPVDVGSGVPIVPSPGPYQPIPGPGGLPPGGLPPGAIPAPGGVPPGAIPPGTLPPGTGAPVGPPDRLLPVPQATPVPANPSSRIR